MSANSAYLRPTLVAMDAGHGRVNKDNSPKEDVKDDTTKAPFDKTSHEEANKVADELPPPRKRARANSNYEYEEAHSGPQGAFIIDSGAPVYIIDGHLVADLSAKQPEKLTPKKITKTLDAAARHIAAQSHFEVPVDAICCQERNIRSHMAYAAHQLCYHIRIREQFEAEHQRLLDIMKERKLSPINYGTSEVNTDSRVPCPDHGHAPSLCPYLPESDDEDLGDLDTYDYCLKFSSSAYLPE
ncbi:hypothetical protein DFH07DRAFT_950577 [Mycena maculata]|uniref:Uncharacterized protein n=1 Tax=Mycena maculata TaxID=230809 RepID=A0AAD7NXQ3_9AGAR|nr:hypothetical protein DFH07DRAFT_950577 [Mycena maculata]